MDKKPIFTVFNYKGIILHMWSKERLDSEKKYRFLIFCYGLPSHPYQHNPAKLEKILDENYVLIYPQYIGTWGSDGDMSWENCVHTILETVTFINNCKKINTYNQVEISWDVNDISVVGGSFGGSIALVSGAKSEFVENIIAVASPTNWRNHSRIPEESAEPIEELYDTIQRGWKNLWRIPNKREWKRLVDGSADINPIDYIDNLKEKNVLLIHGNKDSVVSVNRSIDLHNRLKVGKGKQELLILEDEHLGNDVVGRKEVFLKMINFLSN